MSDPEAGSTVDPEREAHVVGCSVKGPSHEENDKPCQDAWDGTQLAESRFVIAVADGLGSASHSHIGSKVASETVVDHLKDAIRGGNFDEASLRDAFEDAFGSARAALQEEADQENVSISDLNTTLLAAAGGPSGVGAAAVGDGGIIRVYREDYHLFVPREETEYANRTTPIQSDHWEDRYRFAYSEEVDGVAAFSDGLENFAWVGKDTPQAALFDEFFNYIWYTTAKDEINNELAAFLDHERYRNISGDDKTIAIATLDIDYEGREPLSEEEEKPDATQNSSDPRSADTSSTSSTETSESSQSSEQEESPAKDEEPDDTPSRSDGDTHEESGGGSPGEISDADTDDVRKAKEADAYEDEVTKARSETIPLKEVIESDRSGFLYSTLNEQYPAVKIFHRQERCDPQRQKLEAMSDHTPSISETIRGKDVVFQWPSAVVTDYTEEFFLGCTYDIEPPDGERSIEDLARDGDPGQPIGSRLRAFVSNFGSGYAGPGTGRYNTAIALATAIDELHKQGVAICDLDPEKIIVTQSELIFTLCDRYAFDDGPKYYPGSSKHERYTPSAEVADSIEGDQYSDQFGLAVHLYQLLLKGYHPFTNGGRNKEGQSLLEATELKEHIADDANSGEVRDEELARYADLPKMIRYNFEQCFIEGFDTPEKRPSARQWVKVLSDESE